MCSVLSELKGKVTDQKTEDHGRERFGQRERGPTHSFRVMWCSFYPLFLVHVVAIGSSMQF